MAVFCERESTWLGTCTSEALFSKQRLLLRLIGIQYIMCAELRQCFVSEHPLTATERSNETDRWRLEVVNKMASVLGPISITALCAPSFENNLLDDCLCPSRSVTAEWEIESSVAMKKVNLLYDDLNSVTELRPRYEGPCQHGKAHPRVADRGDGLQIWKVAANILNNQPRTADKGWTSSLWVGRCANNSLPLKTILSQNLT